MLSTERPPSEDLCLDTYGSPRANLTLQPDQHAKEDRKDHEEHSEEDRWEDTLDDTCRVLVFRFPRTASSWDNNKGHPPTTGAGRLHNHLIHGACTHSASTFETAPTNCEATTQAQVQKARL